MNRSKPALCRRVSVLAALLMQSCAVTWTASLPDPPQRINVELTEYRFNIRPASGHEIQAGRAVLLVNNIGSEDHNLRLIEVPPDFPHSLLEEVKDPAPAPFSVAFRMPVRSPGNRGFFAIDLQPGRYGLVCLVRRDDGISHAVKGMVAEFKVK